MPDCTEDFGSASQLAIHLVVKHPEDGATPTDFGVNLIQAYGEVNDAAIRLSKSMPRDDRQSMKDFGQAQQRLKFMALKMGDARNRTVHMLADFIVGLAGARSGESGHVPHDISGISRLKSVTGKADVTGIANMLRAQQGSMAQTGMCSVPRTIWTSKIRFDDVHFCWPLTGHHLSL